MLIKEIFLGFLGLSFGFLVSGGVFTVLVTVGLIPRFAGTTHTAKNVIIYEEMIILGAIIGTAFSVFGSSWDNLAHLINSQTWEVIGKILLGIIGLLAGLFVGALAQAIAEMLDGMSIMARRIGFRHGIGIVVLSMAIGRMIGSLIYFANQWFSSMNS